MREYGKVFSRIWESTDFRALSEDGRSLVLYLLTSQHGTIAGVFRVPDGYACEDLQWHSERVAKGFANLEEKGFATRCNATKWVWIAKYLEWNPPENPNQRKAAQKMAASIPDECSWKQAFMRVCSESLGLEPAAPKKPFGKGSERVPESGAVVGTGVGEGTGERDASEANASGGKPPDAKDVVFALGVPLLTAAGVKESNARSFLAMQCNSHGDKCVADALEACSAAKAIQPIPWLQARLKPPKPNGKHTGFSTKDYREGVDANGSLV